MLKKLPEIFGNFILATMAGSVVVIFVSVALWAVAMAIEALKGL